MNRIASRRSTRLTWRAFCARDGQKIEGHVFDGRVPCCPCCGEVLEARPESRLTRNLPLGATGYDLDCRACRRFWCVVRHTGRSLRLIRMRRFAAAVRAVQPAPSGPAPRVPEMPMVTAAM